MLLLSSLLLSPVITIVIRCPLSLTLTRAFALESPARSYTSTQTLWDVCWLSVRLWNRQLSRTEDTSSGFVPGSLSSIFSQCLRWMVGDCFWKDGQRWAGVSVAWRSTHHKSGYTVDEVIVQSGWMRNAIWCWSSCRRHNIVVGLLLYLCLTASHSEWFNGIWLLMFVYIYVEVKTITSYGCVKMVHRNCPMCGTIPTTWFSFAFWKER